jgi:hypothetical protein
MNWSDKSTFTDTNNEDNNTSRFWIPIEVHNICAETLVKVIFIFSVLL